jgi:1-aminocyclopropane-1-carboxylate deaminase/D-cysteine desulfhydrase-like pyridoxal-dependent ACC family enzyme
MFDKLPREDLAFLPTPLHRLPHLGDSIGLDELWIKRDDLTGHSFGEIRLERWSLFWVMREQIKLIQ